jgi:hypothetical protein
MLAVPTAGRGTSPSAWALSCPLPSVPSRHRRLSTPSATGRAASWLSISASSAQGGEKTFSWRRDRGLSGLGGVRTSDLPLYGSERVAAFDPSRPVFVCEGEKATDRLLSIGAQAVGTVTGASGPPAAGPLGVVRGLEVVLWPDHDAAGAQHMQRIAAQLRAV